MNIQKDIVYNKLLPYSSLLESQANEQFEEIKQNLSSAVQKYELWPGALYWTNRLNSYLKVYGFHFSKEDHIHLIHLLFELITIENLESPLLFTWCTLLGKLLKKLKVLSRDDLCLPWRPLYELSQRVFQSKFSAMGMKVYPQHTSNAVRSLIQHARNYFSVKSTNEMLEEWRPLLCPFDLSIGEGLSFLSEFLPTLLPPEVQEHGYKLWFEELITFWLELPTTSATEESLIKLFVRLSKHVTGIVDWTPYLSKIFSRILRSFMLPVGRKEFQVASGKDCFEPTKAAQLIVGMMDGSNPKVQKHLSDLMLSLESYYHPSNIGKHTRSLLMFLRSLASLFIRRLKNERFSKPTWFCKIPDAVKLSEDSVDAFVQSVLPALRMSIFSKIGTMEASSAFHMLALVRPEMVLPDLLASTYKALETVTEPHQVTATMQCVSAVSRSLLSGGNGRFPEGKRHLFSLLMLALPGIDANDFRKTILSGLLISSLVSHVPLVDCSLSVTSDKLQMTEEEAEVCSMTSQFEDFVLQLLDRCFSMVDDTRLEQVAAMDRMVSSTGMFNQESIMGFGVAGSVQIVFGQCSPQLFKVAVDKLYRYATSHVFESEIAGRMCADMCSAAVKVDPVTTLKVFLPWCLESIVTILEDPEQLLAEHPDHNLLWNMQLLSQILQHVGAAILPYANQLIECLKKCVHLKSKKASQNAAKTICQCIIGLTMTYPEESRSTRVGFAVPPEEHLYVKDWSAPGDIDNLGIKWHVPTVEELELADRLLVTFLQPEMDRLREFVAGEAMDRDSLHQSLDLVVEIVRGAAAYLPRCEGSQVEGCPVSVVEFKEHHHVTTEQTKKPPDAFKRENLFSFTHEVSDHILQSCENDTQSMFKLIKISHVLLTNYGSSRMQYESKNQAYHLSKSALIDKLRGKKYELRSMMIARAQLQHELRLVEQSMAVFTQSHLTAVQDLIRFSVSSYAQVRIHAQRSLSESLEIYLYSARKIVLDIIPLLKRDDQVVHDQFKGALHIMLLSPVISVVVHDWEMLKDTLPVIVKADHSEKPSILNLMSRLGKAVIQRYEYFSLDCQVPDGCREKAAKLSSAVVSVEEGKCAKETLISNNQEFVSHYTELVKELVNLQENEKLQWRYSEMGIRFLALMIRHDHPFPTCGVQLVVKHLAHDLLAVRKLAVWAFIPILQQQKRKIAKIPVDVAKQIKAYSDDEMHDESEVGKVGEREEIRWLCYDADLVPKTKEEWDAFPFIDKTHWGYYTWPKTLLTHAPSQDQPSLNRKPEDLTEAELAIYESFSSQEFVDKLVGFYSLEENKGKDHYDSRKYTMFKYLFRNFGITFLPLFRPHLEKLVVDLQDSSQRCASEIIAGVVSGSKNWPFEMVQEMQSVMEPLFKQIIEVVTVETVEDWGCCMTDISANRDPRRLHWMLEILADDPLHGNSGSFKDASRLYLLQAALAQQEWRVSGLLHKVIDYLKTHLSHSFKNVRDTVGGMLSQVYLYDVMQTPTVFNPSKKDFLLHLRPLLPSTDQVATLTKDEDSLRFCKTVLMYITRTYYHAYHEHFELLAELLPLVTVEDDEVGPLLLNVCALMAHSFLCKETVPVAMDVLKKGVDSGLWKVRALTLQVLQVLVFQNLFLFASASVEITDLLLRLLEDSQAEVRELAASCISGFVRCGFISTFDKLKSLFVKHSRCKLPKRDKAKSGGTDNGYEVILVKRHFGVLGLAALVEACPYSVPSWLPDVVDELALHLHDPAPIQGTVRKAMSEFRRTHSDNWNEHKQKFSDDQLAVLTDLLISPSYYA